MHVTGQREQSAHLPPRWFIRLFWAVQRAVYSVTRGRFGLQTATADRQGMLRLRTVGRRTGEERMAILGYFEDGADLVTMAMNGWADAEPAWWLNLQAHPDATVDLPWWVARRPRTCSGQGRAAAPVGEVGRIRQGSRRLCGPPLTRDRGRHPVAPTGVGSPARTSSMSKAMEMNTNREVAVTTRKPGMSPSPWSPSGGSPSFRSSIERFDSEWAIRDRSPGIKPARRRCRYKPVLGRLSIRRELTARDLGY